MGGGTRGAGGPFLPNKLNSVRPTWTKYPHRGRFRSGSGREQFALALSTESFGVHGVLRHPRGKRSAKLNHPADRRGQGRGVRAHPPAGTERNAAYLLPFLRNFVSWKSN